MINPRRVVLGGLIGACAGMTAGVILVGVWGGLTSIPHIVGHSGPNNHPVTMFLAGVVVYALYIGLPAGGPMGAVVGLIAGAIWGSVSAVPTVRKVKAPADEFAAEVIAEAFALKSSPCPSLSRGSGLVIALAIPGAIILVWTMSGWWERAKFDRFAADVTRLGGLVENAEIESWSIAVNDIIVDLASTKTDDAELERLARDPMFNRVHSLSLAGTRITDRGVAVLNAHPFFAYLDLARTSLTDQGMASIAKCCPNTLNLSGTRVTDATIRLIEQQGEQFPTRSIDLTDTQVTEESVRQLGHDRPMMLIKYGPSTSPKSTR
jgi:hypothetical protein